MCANAKDYVHIQHIQHRTTVLLQAKLNIKLTHTKEEVTRPKLGGVASWYTAV